MYCFISWPERLQPLHLQYRVWLCRNSRDRVLLVIAVMENFNIFGKTRWVEPKEHYSEDDDEVDIQEEKS